MEVLIYNAGKGVWGDVEQVTPTDFEATWRINALGLFLTARPRDPGHDRGWAPAPSWWWARPLRSAAWLARLHLLPPRPPRGRLPSRSRAISGRRASTYR